MPFDASLSVGVSARVSAGGARPAGQDVAENRLPPLIPFRFQVRFRQAGAAAHQGTEVGVCSGAFAECSGLEATMEPRSIRAGGVNHGALQRVGQVSFATVILRRGMTSTRDLWTWFSTVASGGYAHRMDVEIAVQDAAGQTAMTWGLAACLPVKFKAADLNAQSGEIAIEELHLVHEGLSLLPTVGA